MEKASLRLLTLVCLFSFQEIVGQEPSYQADPRTELALSRLQLAGGQVRRVQVEKSSCYAVEVRGPNFGDDQISILNDIDPLNDVVIDSTQVTSKGVANLRNINSLNSLMIISTYLDGFAMRHIFSMRHLQKLIIVECGVETSALKGVCELDKLTKLSLPGNQLGLDGVRAISCLKGITDLDLGNCNLDDASIRHIADNLLNLSSLDVYSNKITDESLNEFSKLNKLKELNIANNNLVIKDFVFILPLKALDTLVITGNVVDCSVFIGGNPSQNLRRLYLERTHLKKESMLDIGNYHNLETLSLAYNNIGNDCLRLLYGNRKLSEVYLDGTAVTDSGVESMLRSMPSLRLVGARDTLVTPAKIKRLKTLYPNVAVVIN